jgi:hypothetical protein
VKNFWYGNGIFVAGISPNVEPSVTAAAELRDKERQIKKVYVWTLAKEDSIDRYVGVRKVDGVFVTPVRSTRQWRLPRSMTGWLRAAPRRLRYGGLGSVGVVAHNGRVLYCEPSVQLVSASHNS